MMYRLLTAFSLVLMFALPARAAKHALLIGIADYAGSGFNQLDGTINDVDLVRGMLKDRFHFGDDDILVLKNGQATHEGIRSAFARLAATVGRDDFVYIHFSGHGSLTPNLNGQKTSRVVGGVAYDSTWVSYGATRDPRATELNQYDVLDEEIGEWLLPIYAKTDNVAFVSDSCHASNMTRGAAPKVRFAAVDKRPHPLGPRKFRHSDREGVVVSAVRQDQQANEYLATDGKYYGLFTWNWVQALYLASPGDSWDDVEKRAVALIGGEHETRQHPQIQGQKERSAFGGAFARPEPSLFVSSVSADGKGVTIKAGRFVGITVGSVYRKQGGEASFKITSVEPFAADGEVTKGTFKGGDLVAEETHVYPYQPVTVFVRADLDLDRALADGIREEVGKLPGYAPAPSQKEANLLVLAIRPKKVGDRLVRESADATLPVADPLAKPEIWVLGSDERGLSETVPVMRPETDRGGAALVAENLKKLSRILELKRLGGSGNGGAAMLEVQVSQYTKDADCSGDRPLCLEVPERGKYRRLGPFPALRMQDRQIPVGDILTFGVKNTTDTPLYCYLLDLASNGTVNAIFPEPSQSDESVLVPANAERNFLDLDGLLVEESGVETVKVIASQMPLDVRLFEQKAYKTRGQEKGGENPLEDFLSRSMGGQTRSGRIAVKPGKSQWGTVQFSFEGVAEVK